MAKWGRIEGFKECREALQELSRGVQGGIGKRSLRAPAGILVASVKMKAPVSTDPHNPTPGSLRASVKIGKATARKGGARLEILADDVAAVPNEFGTSKMTAQPFFRPGVDVAREAAAVAFAASLKQEVDTVVARVAKRSAK